MGLNVQAAIDESILDVPHRRGAPFQRGVLASGIATALFYISIGRTASVSDVDFMARTSSLSKNDIGWIYGGVAVLHTLRVSRDGHFANFFVRPGVVGERGMRVGVSIDRRRLRSAFSRGDAERTRRQAGVNCDASHSREVERGAT